ncbi:hypothetical protein FA13DRAFT_884272 [Coprinellus micaceus]|uniref:Uncharacterized protein n=1 Tax=Coprinellus micaceus TaxID=71717 RepID=A0A4Y7RZK6_COPMI|nr:hypothetical protein FA13DRAFT_884272 [Coprinellus micaceus]
MCISRNGGSPIVPSSHIPQRGPPSRIRDDTITLAAALGRVEIVNLLLEQEIIDDTLVDANGKTCKDVARNKEVLRALGRFAAFPKCKLPIPPAPLHPLPSERSPPANLIKLLDSPRVKLVDLSHLDSETGSSLLHEAARRKDLRLIELAVRAGADVFLRNRRGKTAQESVGKDDRVKVFLRQFANHDKTPALEHGAIDGSSDR